MKKKYIDKLTYILIRHRRVLATLSQGKDTWMLPGGKREGNETDIAALSREVKEELTVDLIEDTIKPYGVFEAQAHGKPKGTIVRMTCYTGNCSGLLKANAEIERIDFHSYAEREICSEASKLIYDDLKKKDLID